jgi:hypothetical protein
MSGNREGRDLRRVTDNKGFRQTFLAFMKY